MLIFIFADLFIIHGNVYALMWVMVGYIMRKDEFEGLSPSTEWSK